MHPGASKGRSARRLLFQSSPLRRPLRARAPTGSDAFAAAPYCGGSYLTPAKWQMCGGSCSQKPRTRVRTGGAVSPRYAGSASRVAVSTNASVRPSLSSAKNSPTARSRLRRFGTGGPQGACQSPPSVRPQNSGPTAVGACYARRWRGTPLASLARQPFGKSAPEYRRLHRYAAFGLPIDSTGTAPRIECHLCLHAQLLMDPLLSRMNFMRIPAQVSLHALRQIQTGMRCSIHPVRGAYALISNRADSTPPHLCAPDTGAQ